jgi:hypothetical protein
MFERYWSELLKKILYQISLRISLPALLQKELRGSRSILDLGCGQSSSLSLIRDSYKVGLDYFKPYIFKSKMASIHDAYVLADVRYLPFRSKSFQCTVAIEVLEHLDKQEGPMMIRQMEQVTQRKVILTTPNGFFEVYVGPDALNPAEKHVSGWSVSDLKKLGFKVHGLRGLKSLYKALPGEIVPKFKPEGFFYIFACLSQLITYLLPSLAFQLFCIKRCDRPYDHV